MLNLNDYADPNFYAESKATSHMTNNAGKLDQLIAYKGSNKIFIGNGKDPLAFLKSKQAQ